MILEVYVMFGLSHVGGGLSVSVMLILHIITLW